MALSVSVPFLEVEHDDELYRGETIPPIELTAEQRLTLLRIQAGMIDDETPLTARAFPDDALRHIIDLVTVAAAE